MTYVPQNTNPGSLYNFLLQQMAAESYFEKPMSVYENDQQEVINALRLGTNRDGYKSTDIPFNDKYPGLTRMTKAQAEEFVKKFQIIHQWSDFPDGARPTAPDPNTLPQNAGAYLELNGQQLIANTGLSATLIRVKAPNGDLTDEYTLSIRSTEFRPFAKGGDGERDTSQADLAIFKTGFAFAQLDALENYYRWLQVNNLLPAGAKLNVTGYSLGGHLATVFTEIHNLNLGQTVTFNGAGRGVFDASAGSLADMLRDYHNYLQSANAGGVLEQSQVPATEWHLYTQAKKAQEDATPFDPLSIYSDPRHLFAEYEVQKKYQTRFGGLPDEGNDDTKVGYQTMGGITQVWGREIPHNVNMTSNSGIHGPALGVFIESQPIAEGWTGPGGNGDFGNGHAIVLLADSLVLMRTMQQLVPTATIDFLTEKLFPLSTNVTSDTDLIGGPRSGEYEYDALENVLDGLRRVFIGASIAKTDYTKGGSGFADLQMRQQFHLNVAELANSAAFQAAQGKIVLTQNAPDPIQAKTDFGQFLSLYYLTPFSVSVSDPTVEALLRAAQGTVGSDWAHDKALSADDRAAGKAVFSDNYLADRAQMLTFKIEYNKQNKDYSEVYATTFGDMENLSVPKDRILFTDLSSASVASRASVIDVSGSGNESDDQRIYFGSEADGQPSVGNDSYSGSALGDHLYGMSGDDTLMGEDGADFRFGDNGRHRHWCTALQPALVLVRRQGYRSIPERLAGQGKKEGREQEKWTPRRCPFFMTGIRQRLPAPVARS